MSEQPWIPVEKELPPGSKSSYSDRVLVALQHNTDIKPQTYRVSLGFCQLGKWRDDAGNLFSEYTSLIVTHWKPLDKHPRADEETVKRLRGSPMLKAATLAYRRQDYELAADSFVEALSGFGILDDSDIDG